KAMLVMSPIRRVRSCATTLAAKAMMIAMALTMTTRRSTIAGAASCAPPARVRSPMARRILLRTEIGPPSGLRTDVGPASGLRTVVGPPSCFEAGSPWRRPLILSPLLLPLALRRFLFKEHGRLALLGAERGDHRLEPLDDGVELGLRERRERGEQLRLDRL